MQFCKCFGFALLRFVIGLKNLAPLSRPIGSKTKTNRDSAERVFPALGAGYMHLLRALIGSLDCLRLL